MTMSLNIGERGISSASIGGHILKLEDTKTDSEKGIVIADCPALRNNANFKHYWVVSVSSAHRWGSAKP
jgi:hypothetical protein